MAATGEAKPVQPPHVDTSDISVPYAERPEWRDVTPVPQDDGPEPLVTIRYPPGFAEVHSYFRAIQQRNEFSARALSLTEDVIEHNSANYTAWYYRRRCLKEMGNADFNGELRFIDNWARDSPKNYQVWYHRRWLVDELAGVLRTDRAAEGASKKEIETETRALAERELEYHHDVMSSNNDYKNYNGWSHRQFIVQKFGLWPGELKYVEELLTLDVRNNSAWNHRFTTVRNLQWPPSEESRQREIDFTLGKLRCCASNESAWNYLGGFLGEGEGKVPWDSVPAVEAYCREAVALAQEKQQLCRFALEALARVALAREDINEAVQHFEVLKDVDSIRASYWGWRAALARRNLAPGGGDSSADAAAAAAEPK